MKRSMPIQVTLHRAQSRECVKISCIMKPHPRDKRRRTASIEAAVKHESRDMTKRQFRDHGQSQLKHIGSFLREAGK